MSETEPTIHRRTQESIPWGYDIGAIDDFARTIFRSPEPLRPDRCGEFLELVHELAETEQLAPREFELLNFLYLPGLTYAEAGAVVGRDGRYAMRTHAKAAVLMVAAMRERTEWAETAVRDYWLVTRG